MLYDQRDIRALQLLYWCQYAAREDLQRIATETELINLENVVHFMKHHEKSGGMVLTAQGLAFMGKVFPQLAVPKQSYHPWAIQRRLRVAQIAATFYRAGLSPFETELPEQNGLLLTSVTRGKGCNPWANTRVAAIAHMNELLCAVHYVCPGIGKVLLNDEVRVLNNAASQMGDVQRALLFAGASYADILAELNAESDGKDKAAVSYADVYRHTALPVYLVSCNDTGALQLRIMSEPDYRRRLTKLCLRRYCVPSDTPEFDAVYEGVPLVMAVDMDLRRVNKAVETARELGHPRLNVIILKEQNEAFARRYPGYHLRMLTPTRDTLVRFLGGRLLYETPSTAYLTEDGEPIHVREFSFSQQKAHRLSKG